jgi:2-succinyl-5-enolpyruvyl-6-hydroxy-3-cyclohexene-1-carboxylate synthase
MLHDKTGLGHMAQTMIKRGITDLIISPGSRNAPIVTVFCNQAGFNCLTIVDERSAAFFALGMAQQLNKPVMLTCTSGSAALNYAPAIVEAYYQRIPLIILTADRPVEWIDQGDGQTIRQQNVFANFIRKSVHLPQSIKYEEDLHYSNRLVSEAVNACQYPVAGPVHINLPFTEPLYGFDYSAEFDPRDITIIPAKPVLGETDMQKLAEAWNGCQRKLIIVGQAPPNAKLENLLIELSNDPSVVILTESTSNVYHQNFIGWIDRTLSAMPDDFSVYTPELLVTIGGTIVSKRIKAKLRKADIHEHWHIDPVDLHMDTFQHLTRAIPIDAVAFLEQFIPTIKHTASSFSASWSETAAKAEASHHKFLDNCPWTDLKILETVFDAIPQEFDVQLGNSTPVRYSQLFKFKHKFRFDSNRGTSGIDGSISTAAGAAYASGKLTLMLTGDLGFFYDSNALWNKHLPPNLKIIMINNEGGGIFRFIDGPDKTGLLEEFFEARHQTSAKDLAKAFNVDYYHATDPVSLKQQLHHLFEHSERAAMLEINSPAEKSAETLRAYFRALGD